MTGLTGKPRPPVPITSYSIILKKASAWYAVMYYLVVHFAPNSYRLLKEV
jgi:hypothetical protein